MGGWGLAPRSASLGADLLTTRMSGGLGVLAGCRALALIGPRAARHDPIYSPTGGDVIPYIRMSITASEAPVIAAALDEYRSTHDLHRLYTIRLQQLADELRDAHARIQARERENRC